MQPNHRTKVSHIFHCIPENDKSLELKVSPLRRSAKLIKFQSDCSGKRKQDTKLYILRIRDDIIAESTFYIVHI